MDGRSCVGQRTCGAVSQLCTWGYDGRGADDSSAGDSHEGGEDEELEISRVHSS
jgi:hypothetical protein